MPAPLAPPASGRILSPHGPLEPSSIHRVPIAGVATDVDQTRAKKMANQLCYGRTGEEGKFFGYEKYGYGGVTSHFAVSFNVNEFTNRLYVVPVQQPRVRVWIVKEEGNEEELRTYVPFGPDIKSFLDVPMPLVADLPQGRVPSLGKDGQAFIWCPGEDRSWQFHRLSQFKEGPLTGQWKCGAGHAQLGVTAWHGVIAAGTAMSMSASKMSLGSCMLTFEDLIKVALGGEISHAMGLAAYVTKNEHVAPATGNDTKGNTTEKLIDGITANPAFGQVDEVAEGSWFRFNPAAHPAEFGLNRKLQVALFTAFQKYGIVLHDGAGNCCFQVEDPANVFTKYSSSAINPFIHMPDASLQTYMKENVTAEMQKAKEYAALPDIFEGPLKGIGGILDEFPWRELLEVLVPREA